MLLTQNDTSNMETNIWCKNLERNESILKSNTIVTVPPIFSWQPSIVYKITAQIDMKGSRVFD